MSVLSPQICFESDDNNGGNQTPIASSWKSASTTFASRRITIKSKSSSEKEDEDDNCDDFSWSFGLGITTLPCIGAGRGLADLSLYGDGLTSWQAKEVQILALKSEEISGQEALTSAFAQDKVAMYPLPHDLEVAVQAALVAATKSSLSLSSTSSPSSTSLHSSQSNSGSPSLLDLLSGSPLRFAKNLVLLHAALRARRQEELKHRRHRIALCNSNRCRIGAGAAPMALYPSDLRNAVCISHFRGGWTGRSSDWVPLQDDAELVCGEGPLAQVQFRISNLSLRSSTRTGDQEDVAVRKSPDDIFGMPVTYAGPAFIPDDGCEFQGSGFISMTRSSVLPGGLASVSAPYAVPSEILLASELRSAPGQRKPSRRWSQACGADQLRSHEINLRKQFRSGGVSSSSKINIGQAAIQLTTPGAWATFSTTLRGMVMSSRERFVDLLPTIRRFMFLIPKARALTPRMIIGAVTPSHEVSGRSTLAATEALARRSRSVYHEAVVRTDLSFPDRRLVQFDCGKLQMLADLLRDRKSGGHRVLIFTQMTRMLDVLETFLNLHDHTYVRLDGSTKVEERQKLMDRFNRDTRIFVFILSTRSGGLGINLTGADTVVFYDSDWNPAMDAQAQDRAHRIGQTRDVHIFRLVTESTIEEKFAKGSPETPASANESRGGQLFNEHAATGLLAARASPWKRGCGCSRRSKSYR
jgi:hypothetical protein